MSEKTLDQQVNEWVRLRVANGEFFPEDDGLEIHHFLQRARREGFKRGWCRHVFEPPTERQLKATYPIAGEG